MVRKIDRPDNEKNGSYRRSLLKKIIFILMLVNITTYFTEMKIEEEKVVV